MEFQVRYWPYFFSNSRLQVVLDWKSSQEYRVNAGVPQGFILGPALFLLYINDLPDDVVCNIAIYADDTTLCSKYDQASGLWQQPEFESESELEFDLQESLNMNLISKYDKVSDLWQQLELASELESDLGDTVDWGRK